MSKKTFDEVVLFARTGLNPRTNFKLGIGDNKYITIKNIHDNEIIIDENTDVVDDAAIALIHKRSQIKKGDILFCSIGRMGDMYIIQEEPEGWDINESVFAFTVDTSIVRQKYFYYIFKNRDTIEYLIKNSSGSTFKSIKMNQLKKMVFDLPSLSEQDTIVAILDTLSLIIQKREDELKKLDNLIKARFVELFADERNMLKMSDICSIITDGTHQPPKFVAEGIPFIFVSNVVNDKLTYDAEKYITQETYDELIKRTPIEIGDVLLSTVGSYGHPAVVESDRKFLFQRHIAYLKPKKEIVDSYYLHGALLSPGAQRQIEEGVKGIAQKTLNLSEIKKMKIPVPDLSKQKQFADHVKLVDKSKKVIQKALDEAQTLFDSLMQQYFG